MNDDDLITGLQASVRLEVVEHYLRERRIIDEEIGILFETSARYHHQVAEWRKNRDLMMTALITAEAARSFSRLTGLASYEDGVCWGMDSCRFETPRVFFTRFGRYSRLIEGLYLRIYELAQEAGKDRGRLNRLWEEVNSDIKRFELNHDLMAINAYLRSMNPQEIQKRKILGVNFTPSETAQAAQALSFRPIALEILSLDNQVDPLLQPAQAMAQVKPLLKEICKNYPKDVDMLFIRG